jgi:hypothetical protein
MGNKESGGNGGPPPAKNQSGGGGGGGGSSVTAAIGTQKSAIANLDKKIHQMELMIGQERKLAKQCLSESTNKSTNQKKAKNHLMRARVYQKRLDKFEGMRNNLEVLQQNLEDASMTKDVAGSLVQAKDAFKQTQKDLDPDAIAELQDEVAEMQQGVEEAGTLLAQSNLDPGVELDADGDMAELMKELEEEGGEVEEPAVKTKKPAPKLPNLPVAPTTKVVMKTADQDEEDQLNALMRDMN